jgi:hypothetical protein
VIATTATSALSTVERGTTATPSPSAASSTSDPSSPASATTWGVNPCLPAGALEKGSQAASTHERDHRLVAERLEDDSLAEAERVAAADGEHERLDGDDACANLGRERLDAHSDDADVDVADGKSVKERRVVLVREHDVDGGMGAMEVAERLGETVVDGARDADPQSTMQHPAQRGDRVAPPLRRRRTATPDDPRPARRAVSEHSPDDAPARRPLAAMLMTLGAWLVAFLVALALLTALSDELESLPLALRAFVISGVLVTLMANLVMPILNVAIARWLTGTPTRGARASPGAAPRSRERSVER